MLWDFLERGACAETNPPESRFNFKAHHDASKKPLTMRGSGGMFLEQIDLSNIDAQFFGLSRVEAISMDPQQRQLLEVVYEGLENAGISLEALKGKSIGCFSFLKYTLDYGDSQSRDPEDKVPAATIGIGRAMLSNRISHFLDIHGPSMTIDTACSGGLVAVDVACHYLQTSEIQGAIVAGCNLYLSPEHSMDQSMSGAVSTTGRCHTFDAKADGYVKAEAVNSIVLKRLEDAIKDGDPIRAVIRGSATTSDGWTAGIASPSSHAQALAIRRCYEKAYPEELTKPRKPEQLRLPEFAQPLVTALQILIWKVFAKWEITPQSVVGHSSGEMVAAVAGGFLTCEQAIRIAYYRGKAASLGRHEHTVATGMLAVGVDLGQLDTYTHGLQVQVACINSSRSITISGQQTDLAEVKARVQADGHFARLLQVDLAYHSKFIVDTAARYKELLVLNCEFSQVAPGKIDMFSTVTGRLVEGHVCDAEYWVKNMVSPVLFKQAAQEMISGPGGPDLLIEIGPSGALAGPLAQIKKDLQQPGSTFEYHPALKRDVNAADQLFDIAGRIFNLGGHVNMTSVNEDESSSIPPSTITDLPNYAWNHSTKYWHESESSKDWRFRKFIHHDLLGSKVDNEIIFPAAGYIAMAVEAMYQTSVAVGQMEEQREVQEVCYRLRNVVFGRAMALNDDVAGVKSSISGEDFSHVVNNSRTLLCESCYVLLVFDALESMKSYPDPDSMKMAFYEDPVEILQANELHDVFKIPNCQQKPDVMTSAYCAAATRSFLDVQCSTPSCLDLISFSAESEIVKDTKRALVGHGWQLSEHRPEHDSLTSDKIGLVLDELSTATLRSIDDHQWRALQRLIGLGKRVLWVTTGSQLKVAHPDRALIHGLSRTARAEDPLLVLVTLDVESATSPRTHAAINDVLRCIQAHTTATQIESEFAERDGTICISRVLLDDTLNRAQRNITSNPDHHPKSLFEHDSCIKLVCLRPGNLDTLCFQESSASELPLEDDFVEVDVHAAGLNYKRVLIHSAAGGVGIAAIQLCQYIGAEIYATVGTETKRAYLMETFGIPADRIFSSRNSDFATKLKAATDGEGVNIILNSLSGDLLEESWHCIADGGTMVEIGKVEIVKRNTLSMEPFSRNASYRAVDMSHRSISRAVIARYLVLRNVVWL
ncbi:MAG: hypothetical protein Q9181_002806 [Wetmoreana brouardii]